MIIIKTIDLRLLKISMYLNLKKIKVRAINRITMKLINFAASPNHIYLYIFGDFLFYYFNPDYS